MTRLKSIRARLAAAPHRFASRAATPAERSRERDATQFWRRWYKTYRWQQLRLAVLRASAFTCARCGRVEESAQLVADHIVPHRGEAELFWNPANLQCLCKPCHDGAKQREERAGAARG